MNAAEWIEEANERIEEYREVLQQGHRMAAAVPSTPTTLRQRHGRRVISSNKPKRSDQVERLSQLIPLLLEMLDNPPSGIDRDEFTSIRVSLRKQLDQLKNRR